MSQQEPKTKIEAAAYIGCSQSLYYQCVGHFKYFRLIRNEKLDQGHTN